MIQANNLTKVYSKGNIEIRALNGIDLKVGKGGVCCHTGTIRMRKIYAFKCSGVPGESNKRKNCN